MAEEKNLEHAQGGDIPEELQHLKDWWKIYGDRLSTVVLIVLACIVAWNFYQKRNSSKEAKASIAYSAAASAEEMEAVITDYKGSPVAPLAELRLASDYYHRQNYEQALDAYDRFLKNYPAHKLALIARMGRAHTLEATGKFEEADVLYRQVIQDHPQHYLAQVATLGTARVAAFQGRKDEARTILDRMLAEQAGTAWGSAADELLAALPRLEFSAPQATPSLDMDALFNTTSFGEE